MRIYRMRVRTAMVALFCTAMLFCGIYVVFLSVEQKSQDTISAAVAQTKPQPIIVVDAGHGGVDGGAVGADGTLEKDINLAIALQLRDLLHACGLQVKLTREADISIHNEDAVTIRQKKVSDIQNRTALVNETPHAILLSIHQNKYGATQYAGTQVFYSTNCPQSQVLAAQIQQTVCEKLQPTNTRKIKPAKTDIYLLYHAQPTAVMVECGFLSNVAEREKLKDAAYQKQLAFAIAAGLCQFLSSEYAAI